MIRVGLTRGDLAEKQEVGLRVHLEYLDSEIRAQFPAETQVEDVPVEHAGDRMDRVVVRHEASLRLRGADRDDALHREPTEDVRADGGPDGLGGLREDVVR